MSTKNFIFKNRIYRGGAIQFLTYSDISSNQPLSELVQQNPINTLCLKGCNIGLGTTLPAVALDTNRTDAFRLPSGSNIDRPHGNDGMIRFNSEILSFEGYSGTSWISLAGLRNESGDTYIIPEYSALLDDKSLHFYTQNIERMTLNNLGNLGIGTTMPRQIVDVIGNVYLGGNLGIGTTIPLKPLHVEEGAVFLNGNIGVGTSNPQYNLDIQGSLKADTLYTTTVSISNLTISGSSFLQEDSQYFRNNITLRPIRYTELLTQSKSIFSTVYTGIYKLLPEMVEVYQNGHKLAYISSNATDYSVSYLTSNNQSIFNVTLGEAAKPGDVMDIVFYPTYMDPNGLLQPGYTIQNVQYSYWQFDLQSSNIYYLAGNVGIGTNGPNYLLEVQGDGYIPTLFSSNTHVQNILSIESSVGIQTSQPNTSLDLRSTDGIRIPVGTTDQRPFEETGIIRYNMSRNVFEGYSQARWVTLGGIQSEDDGSKIITSNDGMYFYTNSNLQMVLNSLGNVGIGTDRASQRLDVQGSMIVNGDVTIHNQLITQGTLTTGSLNISGTLVTDQTMITSNLYVMGKLQFGDASSNLKSKIQQAPVRNVFYVNDLTQDNFEVKVEGIYGAEASNVIVYVQRNLLSYYSSNLNDYTVSYSNSYVNFNTTYNIHLQTPAVQGDLVDITVFPQLIEIETSTPGYVYQQVRITDTFFLPYDDDVAYLGNVGIGTTTTTLGKLVVAGNIVPSQTEVYNLGTSNLRFKDVYLSGNTINLGGSLIQQNINTGVIEFLTSNNEPVDTRVNQLIVTGNIGIGTQYPSQRLHVQGNSLILGNIGIGIINPQANLHIAGNMLQYGSITTSNLGNTNSPSLTLIQSNSNQPIFSFNNTLRNTCNEVANMDANGNLRLYGNQLNIGPLSSPVFTPSGFIGQENLYTWWGDDTIVDAANNSITPKEPFWKVFTGFTTTSFNRITPIGSMTFNNSYYSAKKWNGTDNATGSQYMIGLASLTLDDGTVTIPTNYVILNLPIKPGQSHIFFLRCKCNAVWAAGQVFITNLGRNTFHRLHGQSTTTLSSTLNTSWIGPNGEMSSSQTNHEWLMFSIPGYVIDQYAYDELNDNKSRYRKNINICVCAGRGNGESQLLYISGIAIRTNPYGLCVQTARSLNQAVNGGSTITWDANTWNYEGLGRFDNTTYNNIRIPICPPKNPFGNSLPDFYLVWIGYESNPYGGVAPYIYLQNPNDLNDRQLLGRFSKCIKGRYGNFLSEQYRIALGLIVPSPDSRFIVYLGNQPYLNLYVDNVSFGLGGVSYLRGIFTEVIDPRGPNPNLTVYTNTPLQWMTIPSTPITNYLSVTSGLTLFLDPELFDINSSIWRDFSGNYYDFTVNSSALQTVNNIKHFNFEGGFGIAKRVVNNTLVNVPNFTNATFIFFSTIKSGTIERHFIRGAGTADYQISTYPDNRLGMYDQGVPQWNLTTFNITDIPNVFTQFNMNVWKLSTTAPQYQYTYNLHNITYSIINASAAYNNGFASIGGRANPVSDPSPNTADYFWGKVGMVLYYNRHLSTSEIIEIYNQYRSRFGLSEGTYASSYNFRIAHPDGRTFKVESGTLAIKLNTGSDFTFDLYNSTSVYNSSRNRYALQQAGGINTYFNHSSLLTVLNTGLAENNLNYSWSFIPNSNNGYQIINDYLGEYYLGYDSSSDRVLIVEASDTRRINFWNISPSIQNINLRIPNYYPLDLLSTPARTTLRGAYSVKRLSINYTGPMVKIRRSTDNVIQDFYADQYGNLGTSNNNTGTPYLSWIGAATGYVDTWYDQSGSNNHATQSTTSIQPVLRPQGYLIDFLNTSTVFMNIPSGTVPVGALNLQYTFVVKHGKINSTIGGFIGSGSSSVANQANSFRWNNGNYLNYWYSNDYTITGSLSRGNVVSVRYNGTNRAGWVNNVATSPVTATSYTNIAGPQYLGKDTVNNFLNGELHNVFIFGSALNDSDRDICQEIL